jgi:hypothetical protein
MKIEKTDFPRSFIYSKSFEYISVRFSSKQIDLNKGIKESNKVFSKVSHKSRLGPEEIIVKLHPKTS